MSKHARWLHDQVSAWLEEGLIDGPLADTLRMRYPADDSAIPWARIIVSSVGAVIFGFGIILFFAYNWADMHKFVKLSLVFAAVTAAHWAGFHLSGKEHAKRGLVESLHVMGTMLFGAGIWLVAQIYHIDEHYPNALFVWGIGAMALAWAMPSIAQGMVAVVLIFLWGCLEVFDFSSPNHPGPWLVLVGLLPLAWLRRSRVLLFFSLVAFFCLYTFSAAQVDDDLLAGAIFYLACLYLALGRLAARSAFPESAPVITAVGYVVYLVLVYALTFEDVAGELVHLNIQGALEWSYTLAPFVAAVGAWTALLLTGAWQRVDALRRWQAVMIVLAMVLLTGLHFGPHVDWIGPVTLLFNLIFLGHCVVMIVRGTEQLNWKQVTMGCVLFSALAFARFFDLFDSLLMRSLFFLALGAGLFLIGNFYARRKRLRDADHA